MTENVYEKARQVLRERGWRQGEPLDDEDGGVCILGACAVALDMGARDWTVVANEHPVVMAPLIGAIREQFPDAGVRVSDPNLPWWFNDDQGRTAADVDLVLDKAARAWDEAVR